MRKLLSLFAAIFVAVSMWGAKYELVTSASQLVAGCNYIMADGTTGTVNVVSTESNTNNRRTTTGTVVNSQITATDAMMVFELAGSTGAWIFETTNYLGTNGDLYNNDTNNNRLFVGTNDNFNKFAILFTNNEISSISNSSNTSKGIMCFNGTLVACYGSKSSTYKVPQLYKEVIGGGAAVEYTISIDEDIENGSVEANITSAEEGTEITLTPTPATGYQFDSWTVTNASTSATITVTDNKFTMPAANVNVSATFIEKVVNPNEIVFDFNDASAYPAGFPTSGTNVATAQTFSIGGNNLIINAPNSYYIINNTTANRGLFFGKTTAANNKPTEGTAYLGFPAIPGKKLVKVVATTTASVAGSVKMNIYDASWNSYSTEVTTVSSTKKEFSFTLANTVANTEYRLASGSSGKNLQFDNIVLTYVPSSEQVTINATAGYASYACAHNFTISGAEAYKGRLEGTTLTLTKLEGIIPAEEGVILKKNGGGEATILFTEDAATATVTGNDLFGTLTEVTATSIEAELDGYVCTTLGLKDGEVGFRKPAGGVIAANKAYLLVEASASSAPIRIIEATDAVTAVENVEATETVKFMENGQLFIKKNGVIYNAMGQIVK